MKILKFFKFPRNLLIIKNFIYLNKNVFHLSFTFITVLTALSLNSIKFKKYVISV